MTLEVIDALECVVVIKNASPSEVEPNQTIYVKPFDYIRATIDIWSEDEYADSCLRFITQIRQPSLANEFGLAKHLEAKNLIDSQAKALRLFDHTASFLWGPPGTGKTYTIANSIQILMEMYPHTRILLVSMTNHGANEPVKRLVESMKERPCSPATRITRYGAGGDRQLFDDNPQLLPKDGDPLRSIDQDFDSPQVLPPGIDVFTAYGAQLRFNKLSELPLYDFVILDEASQLCIAAAAALCTLGKQVLFTGDHTQLSPVCKTKSQEHFPWVGQSMFAFMPERDAPNKVMLVEQMRMPEQVCKFVSQTFYDKKLRVADIVANDPKWLTFRQRIFAGSSRFNHFLIDEVPMSEDTETAGQQYRIWSAKRIVEMIRADGEVNYRYSEMSVLVPFAYQVCYVKKLLKEARIKGVCVSTVHKVQGDQYPLCFLGPVNSLGEFMAGDIGKSVVNVGASRTMSKLILLLSPKDLQNPHFGLAREIAEQSSLLALKMENEATAH
jgi:DNA replication ATP-dependent helicase Dna2